MVEPPYGVIWNRLQAGKVIPFLGAGASIGGRPPGASWSPTRPDFLPSGAELSNFLAAETMFPSETASDRDDLAKVASYYCDLNGRPVLRERLRQVLNRDVPFGELHKFLAAVPTPQVIVVTNYDTLLEEAFRSIGRRFDLIIHPADRKDIANAVLWWPHGSREPIAIPPNELDIDLASTAVIYKMHGTLERETDEWDNFVITEEDYIEFLSRMTANAAVPSLFYKFFRERSFLFLGYSLRDWNLRVILKNLSKLFSARSSSRSAEDLLPSWAIQFKPQELERRLWEKRNVNIFDLSLDIFIARMKEQRGD